MRVSVHNGGRMRDLDEILKRTIENMRSVTDCDAVVGKPVRAEDGTVMLPVSRVSYGFVAGGGEYALHGDEKAGYPCAGAGGGGITVTPLGFLVCGREKKFIPVRAEEKAEGWKEVLRAAVKAAKGGERED